VLVQAGYEVMLAGDGKEALDLLRNGDCRLVLSDWEMPVMDGLELCKAVRSGELPGYIYFILLTGHRDHDHVVEGLSAGADDFISKPFSPAELRVRVRAGERILSLETRDIAIFALAKLTESRDPETGAHLERVQNYCRVVARHLFEKEKFKNLVDPEYIRLIYITSPLHDIGKVGIPDRVLLKPGRLTEEEFEIMKTHTTMGAETLEAALKKFPNAKFLQMARDIALSHHERYDGTGYPRGLNGEAIPLCGRIVSLADVYDALTSKRVYKEDYAHEVAESILLEESGKQFDPEVVEAFKANQGEFIAIRERFHEKEPVIV
jgi:putative two-component system response regulator